MEYFTYDYWDEEIWGKVQLVYQESFGNLGAKPEKIIRNMFAKQLCFLHIVLIHNEVVAMALTGRTHGSRLLIIDYLAVRKVDRKKGIGQKLLEYIKTWCLSVEPFVAILIEVESAKTAENLKRIHFWEKNHFLLTDYVHHYIWVPQTYQAMYLKLRSDAKVNEDGRSLFQYIVQFHKESFQKLT